MGGKNHNKINGLCDLSQNFLCYFSRCKSLLDKRILDDSGDGWPNVCRKMTVGPTVCAECTIVAVALG